MTHQERLAVREFMNNPTIRADIMEHLDDAVSPLVDISTKHNASYGIPYFNCGVIRAVCDDSSVGGCASGVSAGNHARVFPSDE